MPHTPKSGQVQTWRGPLQLRAFLDAVKMYNVAIMRAASVEFWKKMLNNRFELNDGNKHFII